MKVESYKIKGWKESLTGVLMAENKNWILINEVPLDYQADGFSILNKEFIDDRVRGKQENQIETVLKLKEHKAKIAKKFKFGSVNKMTKWIEDHYGLIQFQDENEDSLEIGIIDRIKKNNLSLLFLKTNGKFVKKYTYEYEVDKIRRITFDTDYLYSLSLLLEHNYQGK